ncbi:MAG: PKD domain-containing protein, partial [Bacteroidetes bacterium]|nr:PKD domain-containing protein [Bacteroidota bacterium]
SIFSNSKNACTASDNVLISVTPLPLADAGLPQTICAGQSTTLTATGGGTYQWVGGPATDTYTVTPSSNTTYTVTVTKNACTASDNVLITVTPLPSADAGSPQTICAGQSITLTATGGGTYQWVGGPATATYNVTPPSNATYTVTVTKNGCTASDNVLITVTPLPLADAGLPQTICIGQSSTLTATGGGTYQWVGGPSNATYTVTPSSNTTYTVTVTKNGCTASDNAVVSVLVPMPVEAGQNVTICFGDSTQLNASNGTTYTWSPASGLSNTSINNPKASPFATTTYFVTSPVLVGNVFNNGNFELGNTGFSSSYTYQTNLSPEGTYYIGSNPNNYHPAFSPCPDHTSGSGNMMIVNGSGTPNTNVWCQSVQVAPNIDYNFSTYATSVNPGSPAILQFSVNSQLLGAPFTLSNTPCAWNQFFALWNSGSNNTANICIVNQNTTLGGNDFALDDISFSPICESTDSVIVTVKPLPLADAGLPLTICAGQSATLTATGGDTYQWIGGPATATYTVTPSSNTTYTVIVTKNGCTASDNVLVTVTPLTIAEAGLPQTICAGQSTTLTATGGGTYQWVGGPASATYTVTPSSNTTYTVTVTKNACTASDNVLITVTPLPVAEAGLPQTICAGQSATLTASGGGTYQWVGGPATDTYTVTPLSNTTYTITVTKNGCTASDNVLITVTPLPIADAGLPQTICIGQSTTITATGGGTYQWNGGPATASYTITPSLNATYTVTVTKNACTASDNVTINLNPLPTISASLSTDTICEGTSTTLIASVPSVNCSGIQALDGSNRHFHYATVYDWDCCLFSPGIHESTDPWLVDGHYKIQFDCNGIGTIAESTGGFASQYPIGSAYTPNFGSSSDPVYKSLITDANCCNPDGSKIFIELTEEILSGSLSYNYNWTGPNGFVSSVKNPVINNAAITASGTYTVIVTDSNGCTASDNVILTVTPLPLADAGLSQTLCAGESTTLIAAGGGTYQWNGGPATAAYAITPSSTMTYTVTVTKNACTAADTIQVIVNSLPIAEAGPDQIICLGQSAILIANGGNHYYWSTDSTNQSIIVNPSITTTYTVLVRGHNACTASDSVQVTVKSLPPAEAGSDSAICYGDSISLIASGGINYVWLPVTNLSNPNLNNPIAFPLTDITYAVTVTGNNGCSDADSISITVHPQIFPSAGPDQTICKFQESANFAAQGGATYIWSPSTGLNNPNIYNPIATPNTSTTYTVSVSDVYGCYETDDIILTVNKVPSYTYISDSVSCFSGTDGFIRLSPSGGISPYTFTWTPQVSYDSTAVNISAANYHVTITDNNGCDTTANITINEPPQLIFITSGNVSICTGNSTTINASSFGGTGSPTYTWDNGLGTGNSFVVSPTSATTYTVSVTDANGCTVAPLSLTVTVSPPITVDVRANPATTCFGESIVLTATPNGGNGNYIYTWGQEIIATTQNVTITPITTTMYNVTVSDNCGSPQGFDSIEVIVYPLPVVDFESNINNGCQPLEVNFTDNSTPQISSWLWNFGDTLSQNENSSTMENPTHIYNSAGIYSVSLSVSTTNNCNGNYVNQNMIEVYPLPNADFDFSPLEVSLESPTINFIDLSVNPFTWNWNFGDLESGHTNSSSVQNPVHTFSNSGEYTVFLIVNTNHSCIDSVFKNIYIKDIFTFYAPNAITMNNDGLNDYFIPKGIGWKENTFEMYIYDRWGEQIYSTKDINKPWDGRPNGDSQIAPIGVYTWLVRLKDFTGRSRTFNGIVTVTR